MWKRPAAHQQRGKCSRGSLPPPSLDALFPTCIYFTVHPSIHACSINCRLVLLRVAGGAGAYYSSHGERRRNIPWMGRQSCTVHGASRKTQNILRDQSHPGHQTAGLRQKTHRCKNSFNSRAAVSLNANKAQQAASVNLVDLVATCAITWDCCNN